MIDCEILKGTFGGYSFMYIPTGMSARTKDLYDYEIIIQGSVLEKDSSGYFRNVSGPGLKLLMKEMIETVKGQQKKEVFEDLTGAIVTAIRPSIIHPDTFDSICSDLRYEIVHHNKDGASLMERRDGMDIRRVNGKWKLENLFIINQPSILRDIAKEIKENDQSKNILLLL